VASRSLSRIVSERPLHVALIGDAAHPTTPNPVQGGCMAIEDGMVLAALLATDDVTTALREREVRRFARTTAITQESLWAGRLGLAARPAAWARDVLTRVTPSALVTNRLNRHYRDTIAWLRVRRSAVAT
jgi:2-polyprenyl-6-methoxyphenol hydroxylase-like FAD-dependent oxidoreductase